ncbi:MAG: hypothetical protein QOI83_2320 [Streptomycetaceae bacterium]|jgi:hypothetical protein|nr:hypothetical protein [Streptomycetaceae bacterium]
MQQNEIIEVLNRPISQELLARDVTRLAYVAKDGTPRNVPMAYHSTSYPFSWSSDPTSRSASRQE